MKRLAIFAHFDKKNVIRDYVLFYINELKKDCDDVIFVSCSDLSVEERNKLDIPIVCELHSEYDFGSYKRGFNFANDSGLLNGVDEIIFANDSCYGPIRPLKEVFNAMDSSDCDFWGITKNKFGFKKCGNKYPDCIRPHIQSYFIGFRKNTFKLLGEFLNSVTTEAHKNDVIEKYEIGLSETLVKSGFKDDFYAKKFYQYNNPTVFYWRKLIKYSPLIKRSLFRLDNRLHTTICGWEELIGNYPRELIDSPQINSQIPFRLKLFVFNCIAAFPNKIRRIFANVLERFMPFMLD